MFSAGGRDFLVLTLEWEAPSYALDWARKVLAAYPNRIAILVTHSFVSINGQRKTTERRLFPGYVFVEMVMDDDTWHLVKHTSKVTGFVGGAKNRPAPISEEEVQKIVSQMQEGSDKPRHKIEFMVGELVRVKEGPFTDFNGTVEEVNYEKNRLRVSVAIFGRSTPVELEFAQVEKT